MPTSTAIERSVPPWWVRLAILGGVSGALSWGALELIEALGLDFNLTPHGGLPLVIPLSMVPGLVFGVAFAALLLLLRRVGAERAVLYLLAAGLGYFAAYHAAFFAVLGLGNNSQHDPGVVAWVVGGMLGGLAGTLFLGLASKFLFNVPAARALGLPVIVGTLAGGLLVLMSWDLESHDIPRGLLAFYALWQGAYGASLAPLIADRR